MFNLDWIKLLINAFCNKMSLILQKSYILQLYNWRAYIKSMHVCNFRVSGLITKPYVYGWSRVTEFFRFLNLITACTVPQFNVYWNDGFPIILYAPLQASKFFRYKSFKSISQYISTNLKKILKSVMWVGNFDKICQINCKKLL